jgi:hypothetical protein
MQRASQSTSPSSSARPVWVAAVFQLDRVEDRVACVGVLSAAEPLLELVLHPRACRDHLDEAHLDHVVGLTPVLLGRVPDALLVEPHGLAGRSTSTGGSINPSGYTQRSARVIPATTKEAARR